MLNEKMLLEIFKALDRGEQFEYTDENTQIIINPNSVSIQYTKDDKTRQIEDFLNYCNLLDDELFVDVCESFSDGELVTLQEQLDTENYVETITHFTTRVREIAQMKLSAIINEADAEIKKQEQIISNAHLVIEEIHKELEEANRKYNV